MLLNLELVDDIMKNGTKNRKKNGDVKKQPRSLKEKRQQKNLEKRKWKKAGITTEDVVREYDSLRSRDPDSFKTFDDFPLSEATQRGLADSNYVVPTEIQRDSLRFSLNGADVIGAAKTGSGKTLALVIPILECLWRNKWSRDEGLGAIIISPTRELALQTFNTINKVGQYHDFSCCLLIGGGTDITFEKTRIARMNIIVCTPGRLLQHLHENDTFFTDQLQMLVIDEADRILDLGFSSQLKSIIEALPKERQALLFSATLTCDVNDLSRVCTKDPTFVSVHEKSNFATPDELKQLYLVCEEEEKLNLLWSFITMHRKSKTLVFVSTCKQARFIYEAFHQLNPSVVLLGLWGSMKQNKRIEVFERFGNTRQVCMIATDVASRGLDFTGVDWVVQIDAPPEIDDYIHRVGRTARMGHEGQALLFLTTNQEESMCELFLQRKIPVTRMETDINSMKNIQRKLQATIAHSPELNAFAQRAFVSYVRSVFVMKNKNVFNIDKIHTKELAESMGLISVPRIRFLRKQGHSLDDPKLNGKTHEGTTVFTAGHDFGEEINDLSEDELFTVKKKNVFKDDDAEENDITEEVLLEEANNPKKKPRLLTREHLAQRILNKKIKVNKRTVFDDEDGENEETNEGSSLGLNLEEAKREKMQNDKMDRRAYRAKIKELKAKRKPKGKKSKDDEMDLAGAEDLEDDNEVNLDWLPKPEGWDSDEEDDLPAEYHPELDELLERKKKKRKVVATDKTKTKKRKVITSTDDAEKEVLNLKMAQYYPAPKVGVAEMRDRRLNKNVAYWRRMQQISVFSEPNHVTSVAISPKEPHHIACTSSVRLSLYDSKWSQQVTQFSRFKRAVFGATFRRDGELIAIGGEEGKLRIFDALRTTGKQKVPLRSLKVGDCALHTVRFSTSGKNIFSMADDGMIKKYEIMDTGMEPIVSIKAHDDVIRCGAVSASNENIVISGGYDHKIKLWDVRADSSASASLTLNAGAPIENLLFLPNENLLASAAGNVVKIWDMLAGGRLLTSIQAHHKTVTSLCLGENGSSLLTGAIDRRINVVRIADFSISYSFSVAAPVLALGMSPNDETMAIGMGNLLSLYRRVPERQNIVSLDTSDKKSIVQSNAPTATIQMKGTAKENIELTAKAPDRLFLSKFDQLLKAFKHHDLVSVLFSNKSIWDDAGLVVGKLRVIAYRGALKAAFAGHKPVRQIVICKFLSRNLFLEPYFDTLIVVAEAVFEVFSTEDLDEKVIFQLNRLKDAVQRELTVQKQISQMMGGLELVLSSSRIGQKMNTQKTSENLEVFGEPMISSLRMDLLKLDEDKEEI
ncbi:unnamed protein product, partial [Mesorhabditis belari]|uniref:ATP-dependent RNA helicase n=1 Tax=Mesorhabditis belari TaxID=2138241 RepID=A0AAF3F3S1_9BILA